MSLLSYYSFYSRGVFLSHRLSPEIRLPACPAGPASQRRTAVGGPPARKYYFHITFLIAGEHF